MTEQLNETANGKIRQVSAYLRSRDANASIVFYCNVFGAQEVFRLTEPSDRIAHAELTFGDATIMVSDEYPEMGIMSPASLDGTGVGIYMLVDDVDAVHKAGVEHGAMSLQDPADQFYGERVAKLRDPWGHEWLLAQKKEEISPVEMQERFDAMFTK
jgi:uncharacterized glyoxalase superfamily protein PhnB